MKHATNVIIVTLFLGAAGVASAERGHHPHPPPPVAIEACAGMEEGDACDFQGPEGEGIIEGTCQRPVDELVCVPSDPPPGG